MPRTSPVVPAPAECLLLNAADTNQAQLEAGPSFTGDPDLSREGPFDIHQDHPRSVASPRLLQDSQGCPFRMISYDEETSGPDFTPAYGVQLHDL